MGDNHRIEIAYAIVVAMAWIWALSQVRQAGRYEGWSWHHTTALWMTTKASFFTFVGSVWWFDWFDPLAHELAIYALVAVHLVAFGHWIVLTPPPDDPTMPAERADRPP